jgi:hypothetical protein
MISAAAGENVGLKSINQYGYHYHIKDMQLSYVENEERMYITILNSLNFHEGSAYHQTNTILVVKESISAGNDFYKSYATLTTPYINWLERHKA